MSGVKMRCFGRYLSFVLLGGLAVLGISSCERDELGEEIKLSSNKILYSVGWANGSAITKGDAASNGESVASGNEFLMAIGEDSLFLSFTEMNNNTPVATKSAPIKSISTFNVTAITGQGNTFIAKDKVSVDGNGYGSSNRYWPEDNELNFFAWASSVTEAFEVENEAITSSLNFSVQNGCSGSFSYSLPASVTSAPYTDAQRQPDLIFAISTGQTKTSNAENPGRVKMQFHHALSAIHFKVGNMPKDLTVKSIKLVGVLSGGVCAFTPDNSSDANKPLNLAFDWETSGEPVSYVQDFNLKIPDDRENLGTMDEVGTTSNKEAVFMMIPQDIPSNAKLEITFAVGDNEFTLSKLFSEISSGAKWLADKKYVYVISTPGQVDVEIEDNVTGNVKSDVVITNTGMVPSYVRAALVGNWVVTRSDGTEDIVAAWDEVSDGEFTALCPAGWIKCSEDGYYYFTDILEPGEVASPALFEKYALTASAPVVGAQLRLSVIVQSVIADKVNSINETSGWVFN